MEFLDSQNSRYTTPEGSRWVILGSPHTALSFGARARTHAHTHTLNI